MSHFTTAAGRDFASVHSLSAEKSTKKESEDEWDEDVDFSVLIKNPPKVVKNSVNLGNAEDWDNWDLESTQVKEVPSEVINNNASQEQKVVSKRAFEEVSENVSDNIFKRKKFTFDKPVYYSEEEVRKRDKCTAALPTRDEEGKLRFEKHPTFFPNLSPKEVLQRGSFGGTYFRPIFSSITNTDYDKMWLELPQEWLVGLDVKKMVCSSKPDVHVNKYKVHASGSLWTWETSGWIKKYDPYGWFMWYCRFYLGKFWLQKFSYLFQVPKSNPFRPTMCG